MAMSALTFAVVMPARFGSTRFPGKPLAMIADKPLIEWVYARAREIEGASDIMVATDDERIAEVVRAFDGNVVMTSDAHATGTDRVAEVAENLDVDIIVNLQGDEPVFDPHLVERLVARLSDAPDVDIATAAHRIANEEEFRSRHVVKVVVDHADRALYFSRSPIPSGEFNDTDDSALAMRHVGVYAYRKDALIRFSRLERTPLEESESLEQLRAIENGMVISVIETDFATIGVDVPEDAKNVEKEILKTYTDQIEQQDG